MTTTEIDNLKAALPPRMASSAQSQFEFIQSRPELVSLTPAQAIRQVELGWQTLSISWGTHPGEVVNFDALSNLTEADLSLWLGVMPFICGSINLLDIEFFHEQAGLVSPAVLQELFENKVAMLGSHELTPANVRIRYRRRAH